jgi:GAF domain-containing protein
MTASPTDDHASAGRRIQELTKELSQARGELMEAREQQAATAAILRVISSSPMDLKRVFAQMAANAAHHCGAHDASIFQVDGEHLRLVGHHGPIPVLPVGDDTLPLTRGLAMGRAVLDRRTIHVADMQAEAEEYPESRARNVGFRTILAVPLVGTSEVTGAIGIRRTEAKLFSDKQIALLETFANQAVIAIENARLFDEVQARTREVTEALEYQTATSDVLSVISRSKFDLQPVLDTIARVASQLCVAEDVVIHLREQSDLRVVAHYGSIPVQLNLKRPIERGWVSGRTVVDRKPIHVPDMASFADEFPLGHQLAQLRGYGATLGVPLLRENEAIGSLLLRRLAAQPFAEKQIALLQTFADQAVIAIENARLFEAEQASKRELQESLEYQTATSEVLSVISRSPNELQPVLDTILETAQRLCQSDRAQFFLLENGKYHPAAHKGSDPEFVSFLRDNPISAEAGTPSPTGRAARERRTIHVPDVAGGRRGCPLASEAGRQGEVRPCSSTHS